VEVFGLDGSRHGLEYLEPGMIVALRGKEGLKKDSFHHPYASKTGSGVSRPSPKYEGSSPAEELCWTA